MGVMVGMGECVDESLNVGECVWVNRYGFHFKSLNHTHIHTPQDLIDVGIITKSDNYGSRNI